MSRARLYSFPLWLLLAVATAALAKDDPDSRAAARVSPQGFDQAVYKGLVGNVLDAIPMDPAKRVDLQRTNAVVSSTLSGRSLAVLAGLSNPVLLLGGFVWGVWAASNIKAEETDLKVSAYAGSSGGVVPTEQRQLALLERSAVTNDASANPPAELASAGEIAAADSGAASLSRSHVIKIWLPQRSGSSVR
jgi:hypothetical protein